MHNPKQYQRVQDIFLRLREIDSPVEREAALQELPANIREEVQGLLRADARQDDFLQPASIPETQFLSNDEEPSADLPFWIDRYRLLQRIGEGGHGTVFMAQQASPMERMVAVKLIKPGMDSRQVLARFHAEQQALALMDHPSIARVFDAGTTSTGAPYFVMELVKGIPITEFCETNDLDLADRLRLVVQVCQAVHHAHQKGVIHRDLKPSNILVTMSESGPLAKVIDFGIAKALDARLTDRTLFTEFGQMIGTLEYMSPEQAEMSAVDVDTRSDVYSLGVLLYELLTGTPPITRDQLLRDGLWELSHRLRDTEPPRPSTRITESRQHFSQVGPSRQRLRGVSQLPNCDLDWVTMMALEKDRRRRYDSARDLGQDIQRFLDGEPISARPPSWWYTVGKAIQRHKVACAAVTLTALALLVALAALTWGLQVARRQAMIAEASRAEAERQANRATQERQRANEAGRQLAESVYSELVNSAWEAVRDGRGERANALLQSCLPELRGWEWEFVHDRAESLADQDVRPAGRSAPVAIDIAHSATWSVCVLENGDVEVWDLDQRQRVSSLQFDSLADTACFSPDDAALYVGLRNGRLLTIDTATWRQIADQPLEGGAVYHLTCSRDGQYLAACTGVGWVGVLRRETSEITDQWRLTTRIQHLLFDHATKKLLAAGVDGDLYLFQMGQAKYEQRFVAEADLRTMVRLNDDEFAVLAGRSVVAVPVTVPETEPRELTRLESMATSLAVNRSSGVLFVGGSDGQLMRMDLKRDASGTLTQQYGASVRDLACLPDANQPGQLLIALADGRLRLTSFQRQDNIVSLTSRKRITDGDFLPGKDRFVTVDDGGWMRLWDASTGEVVREIRAHEKSVWSTVSSMNGRRLATVGDDFRLRVWDTATLDLQMDAEIGLGVRALAWGAEGRFLVAAPPPGDSEGTIGIWDVQQGVCARRLVGHENWVMQLGFGADGTTLVSAGENGTTRVWDYANGECRFELESPTRSTATLIAVEEPGERLFLGHRDGQVTAWNRRTGRLLRAWSVFGDALSGLALSPDGDRLLVTSQSDARLKVWDLTKYSQVATFMMGEGYLSAFRLSRQGHWYATMGNDGVVHVRAVGP